MRILQLIQKPQLRGAEVFACQLSEELTKLGHQILVVTVFDGTQKLPFSGDIQSLQGSPSSRLIDFPAWRRLAGIIRRFKPDVIQANAGDTLKYAVLSKMLMRWKTPIIFRNASTISLYLRSKAARMLNRQLMQRVDFVVSVSNYSRNDFVRVFPSLEKRITVIPIGIDQTDDSPVTAQLSLAPRFLHVGGFTFEKNHLGLIDIFCKLKEIYPAATLVLVGDGPLRATVENKVSELGLDRDVMFPGYQPNPRTFFKAADCLLFPSIIEGMPAAILEAFSNNLPVVANDVGGISEIVISGQTGWLIRKGDVEGFVDAVRDVFENPGNTHILSRNAFSLVQEKYRLPAVALEFENVYKLISNVSDGA